jgi:hypothetical protein
MKDVKLRVSSVGVSAPCAATQQQKRDPCEEHKTLEKLFTQCNGRALHRKDINRHPNSGNKWYPADICFYAVLSKLPISFFQ